jgi:outer membrane protein
MRTYSFMAALVLCALMLGACNEKPAVEQKNIGVVDVSRALRDSEAGKAGMKFLENVQKNMLADVEKTQAKIKADPKNEAAQQELQMAYMALQQRFQAEQQNVIGRLNDIFQRVLDTYRTENKLVAVMASDIALSFDKSADVTDAVIAAMNKEKVEFTPVAEPEAADAPKAEPKADAPKADAPKAEPKADAPKADAEKK